MYQRAQVYGGAGLPFTLAAWSSDYEIRRSRGCCQAFCGIGHSRASTTTGGGAVMGLMSQAADQACLETRGELARKI